VPEFLGHPIGDHRGLLERRLVVLGPQQICGRLFEREAFVADDLICDSAPPPVSPGIPACSTSQAE
jgi:hypothetical protein